MANPFENMKEIYKLQKEARQMQKKLKEQKITGESKDGKVTVYMNAAQEYESIDIDDSLMSPDMKDLLEKDIEQAFSDYQKNLQKHLKKSMSMDDIKGMLS